MSSKVDFIGTEPTSMQEWLYTPTASQTTWTLNYTAGRLFVFLNGIKLIRDVDFTADNGTTVVLTSGAATTDRIEFSCFDMGASS